MWSENIMLDDGEYEVERLEAAKQLKDGTWEWHVKWKGYDEITWENEENLANASDLIKEFWETHDKADYSYLSLRPKNTLELTTPRALDRITRDFPMIKSSDDIAEIIAPLKKKNGSVYYWVKPTEASSYKTVLIPAKFLHTHCPEMLIDFLESSVRLN